MDEVLLGSVMPNQRLERALTRERLGAAGAWEEYAPASLLIRRRAAAQLHR